MYSIATPSSDRVLAHRAQIKKMAKTYEVVIEDKVGNGTFRLVRDVMKSGLASYWFTVEVADKRAISSYEPLSIFSLGDADIASAEGHERGFRAVYAAELAYYRSIQD